MLDPGKVIDISVPLVDRIPTYPGLDPFIHEWTHSLNRGDKKSVSRISMSCHVGTHIDAPLHFVPGGAVLGEIGWEYLCGRATVVEIPDSSEQVITESEIPGAGICDPIILLKTSNSQLWKLGAFSPKYRYLDEKAARLLVSSGVRTLGFDYISVDPPGGPKPAHTVLLGAGTIIVEGLNLEPVRPGTYFFVCLPLAVPHSEAAPARAILIPHER